MKILSDSNFSLRPLLAVMTIAALTNCQQSPRSTTKAALLPPIVPSANSKAESKTTLDLVETFAADEQQTLESPALLASAVLVPLAKEGLKWLAKKGGETLEQYGEKFGAIYSASTVRADYMRSSAAALVRVFVFKRTVTFPSKDAAEQELGALNQLVQGTYRTISGGKIEVDAMVVPFAIQTCGADHQSWRFVPLTDKSIKGRLSKVQHRGIVYQGRMAKALGTDTVDKFTIAIAVTARYATNNVTGASVYVTEPAEVSIKGKDLIGETGGAAPKLFLNKQLESNWIPAPPSLAYSVECTVVESSRMKEWISKTSKKLVGIAEKQIDDAKWP